MMTLSPASSRLLFAFLCSGALAACGGDSSRGGGGTKPRADSGVSQTDGGVIGEPDSGIQGGCAANPNSCVMNQLVGQAPACECLNACVNGFTWNPSARRCDPNNNNPDGGVNPTPDGGVNPNPDGGMQAECTSNADCTQVGAGAVCMEQVTVGQDFDIVPCRGGECFCGLPCDAFSATGTCPQGAACTWLGGGLTIAELCTPDQGGGAQGNPCTVQFDAQGNITADSCNRAQNVVCIGADEMNPTGTCSRICEAGSNALCAGFGNYTCLDLENPAIPGIGLCLEPAPNYTDIGNSCSTDNQCQGGVCIVEWAGSCSANCGGLSQCPTGSFCLNLGTPLCIADCTGRNDAFCSGRNANTVCEAIGMGGEAICLPNCNSDATICQALGLNSCNAQTGHCQ